LENFNKELFLLINSFVNKSFLLDNLAIYLAKLTPYFFIAVLFYLWFSDKKNEALFAGYSATLAIGINILISLFYFHPRPFSLNLGTTLIQHSPDSSFPSDHTTFTLSIAFMLLTFASTKKLAYILIIFALLCGISRIYVGVHFPLDIIGAVIVSMTSIIIVNKFREKFLVLNNFLIKLWNKFFLKKHYETNSI